MTTKAVRMYGKKDLRLEEFELPPVGDDEILAHIVSDSICMSSYKAAMQGEDHKRVPAGIDKNPVMIGHEFCGEIVQVGEKWKEAFHAGQRFSVQPALNYRGSLDAPGYSYRYIGGAATNIIIPQEVMEMDCLLDYSGEAYFMGSLAEPMSCIIGTFHAMYHHIAPGKYEHTMGVVDGGRMAILAGVGPMGLGAIDYAIHANPRPALLVVTDIDQVRLDRAASIYTVEHAADHGVTLRYVNTRELDDPALDLISISGGQGYDDVMVFAPVRPLIEQGGAILARDGCLNFFAGPTDPNFSAEFNFYNVHYAGHHLVGTSGGNTDDLREALDLMSRGVINPVAMITHVGGLNAVVPTTLDLPNIPGGKKLIYTNVDLELTALDDLAKQDDPLSVGLAGIVAASSGLWSIEAENYLMANATPI